MQMLVLLWVSLNRGIEAAPFVGFYGFCSLILIKGQGRAHVCPPDGHEELADAEEVDRAEDVT